MPKYRVHLRRECEQVVEVDPADWPDEFAEGGTVTEAAEELADPADWDYDDTEVTAIEISDDGEAWRYLPISQVLRMWLRKERVRHEG